MYNNYNTMTINSTRMMQQQQINNNSDTDSLDLFVGMSDEEDDELSQLSMGSGLEYQECQEPDLEVEEILSDEDRAKIERWTRLREDGFEIINGKKYSETGSIIYSDYSDYNWEEERQKRWEEEMREEMDRRNPMTALGIAAKADGDLQREAARARIAANPEAYEGIDLDNLPDYEDEGYEDYCAKCDDLYLADGGMTNEEAEAYVVKNGLRDV
jgi:hypothetical protein